ncbi:hypothetical protein RhiirA4_428067 [Rhizophagus irregularis]|uniref:Uncharacterized protein n=1 Tax=Rhizophagus irregularis TaxID=588596 RepID=A0A2I1HBC8_9GLOM|nr:hypothetical protein RhiirA4_428067 [Rhizophagus irregularis]
MLITPPPPPPPPKKEKELPYIDKNVRTGEMSENLHGFMRQKLFCKTQAGVYVVPFISTKGADILASSTSKQKKKKALRVDNAISHMRKRSNNCVIIIPLLRFQIW